MDRRSVRIRMERYVNGASFITSGQLMGFLNVSRSTAQRKLRGLESLDGKYYFIPDVVEKLLMSKK